MSRTARYAPGGLVYHVLNRGVGRRTLFDKEGDYLAFEKVVEETLRTRPMRICAFCLLPNHWHLVLWPERDGDLAAFMQQMTNTHVKRWKEHHHEIGFGHLYQERYKSFPVETDDYFYQVVRYVERNALRANLAPRAELWPWSSLRRAERDDPAFPILSAWPLPRPEDWPRIVNQPQTETELEAIRRCVQRGHAAMGDRDGEASSSRVDATIAWEATKGTIADETQSRLPMLFHLTKFGDRHLFRPR